MKEIVLFVFINLFVLPFAGAQLKTVTSKISKDFGQDSESYQSFTFNGSWSWISDPRAVYFEGEYKRTYSGWVDNYGNIIIGYYDHETKEINTHIIKENLEVDDRDNPSILVDNTGKLLVFFNRQGYDSGNVSPPVFLVKSKNAEDITQWSKIQELFRNDKTAERSKKVPNVQKFTNPIRLKAEKDRIYLFWSGTDGQPHFSHSNDNGDIWSNELILLAPESTNNFQQPFTKVYSKGKDKIHFTVTVGNPAGEQNNVYYAYYKNGAFYKVNGDKIKDINDLPLNLQELDLVLNAKIQGGKARICDIAEDENGNPVLAYTVFSTDSLHYYCYAKWNGKKWLNRTLVNAGSCFRKTPQGKKEIVSNYSCGLNIDHENPNELYLSVNRDSVFEIEKWTTYNDGKSWEVDFITQGSEKDNIRPFAVRGATEGNPLQVLWMQNTRYITNNYPSSADIEWPDRFQSAIKINIQSPTVADPLNPEQIISIMRRTADWQFANPYDLKRLSDWQWGTFYLGLQMFYELTGEDRYKQEMINIGEAENWKINDKIFYADMLTAISNWAWLYGLEKRPEMIEHSKWVLDAHLATRRAYKADVTFAGNKYFDEWWTWCDALFVAPPVFARMSKETGEQKYLDYADKMFWITADYLYSPTDSLMFRDDRYFEKLSENGKKIFWGRGNGWVISGITRMLKLMPPNFPSRHKYENMYKTMAIKLLRLQGKDWGWRVSLLDPEYKDVAEMSGSAFYVYALAWGINNGLLDKKYRPQIEKGWLKLCENVNQNGRFGNVQPEGIDPRGFTKDNWHVYGTGAFLMAGAEMVRLANQ